MAQATSLLLGAEAGPWDLAVGSFLRPRPVPGGWVETPCTPLISFVVSHACLCEHVPASSLKEIKAHLPDIQPFSVL